jgi:hypothetical protein
MLGHFLILLATALLVRWLFGFAGAVLALLVAGFTLSLELSRVRLSRPICS